MKMAERRRNRDIQNILTVLGAAVFCAVLLASLFLYYYGPSGRYLAGNTLLDPSIINQINYQDQHPRTGKKVHFAFDRIEFSHFDLQKGQMRIFPISLDIYQHFYKQVASEKSLLEVSPKIQSLFFQSHPALLTVSMRSKEGAESGIPKVFQVVQFIPEDYFRVQLHEKSEGEWAYFYRSGLYHEIMHLFTKEASEK
jgi:hypothetical protein